MGIDSIAIQTFNSTGSQSVCRANEADEERLIESEFLTKCTTEYINGSGQSFISGSVDIAAITGGTTSESFGLPSNVDAASEISLTMRLGTGGENISSTFILDLIRKIEIKLGNLVVQTILPGDIYARNITEFGYAVNVNTYQAVNTINGRHTNGDYLDFSVSIPFTGRSIGVNRAFLQAGAITNSLSMKVYYNRLISISTSSFALPSSLSTGICVFSHTITSTEKNFIAKNIINRPVNTSQSIVHSLTSGITATTGPITIDLSSININVSHILITLNRSTFNSSGISGSENEPVLPPANGIEWGPRQTFQPPLLGRGTVGVTAGWLKSVELILGNERTGNIPGSCLTTNNAENFKLISGSGDNIHILKLASSAFSTAGIPFSRLNNKRLVITPTDDFTVEPYVFGGITGLVNINITCCGTQIQSTVGGTISFSA